MPDGGLSAPNFKPVRNRIYSWGISAYSRKVQPRQGSTWKKWDLHVHTPASFHWKDGKKLDHMTGEEKNAFWTRFVNQVNESDIAVFGIQDYWDFNGYISLRNFLAQPGAPKCQKTVLPGIELRLEAPTNFRLNFHLLFSERVEPDKLQGLPFNMKLSGLDDVPAAPIYILEWAKRLDDGKLRAHGFHPDDRRDRERMLELGYKTVTVTWASLTAALRGFNREDYIVILPYDTSDGLKKLDWKKQTHFDATMFRFADFFECRNQEDVDLFLGRRTEKNEAIFSDFLQCLGGRAKPVVSGSDAHRLVDYGKFPSGRTTWIKSDPTFEGLRQCLADPASRVHIGAQPPKLNTIKDFPGATSLVSSWRKDLNLASMRIGLMRAFP